MSAITEMDLRKSVWLLALPVVARMSLQMLVGLVDTAMVGRIGPAAIAAVGMGNQIVFLLIGLITAFSIGTTALVARYIGAKRRKDAQDVAIQSLLFTAVVSLLMGILGYIFAYDIIRVMIGRMEQGDPEVIALGGMYLRIISISIPFFFSLVLFNGIFQGAGDMKTPLYIMAFTNVYNVIMDYLLIFGIGIFPELGVQGAAIATGSARCLAAVLAFIILLRGTTHFRIRLSKKRLQIRLDIIREVLRIGLPSAMEQLIRSTGQTLITIMVAGLGTLPLAANQVVMRGLSMSFMPGFGFGLAATTLVGQNLGAKEIERAEESGYIANRMAISFMFVMGLLLFPMAALFARIFTDDPEVISLATGALRTMALTLPFLGMTMTLAGALRGAGDTRWVMYSTAVGVWGARLLFSYILAFVLDFGFTGIWLGMSLDFVLRGLLTVFRFKSGRWKTIKVGLEKKPA